MAAAQPHPELAALMDRIGRAAADAARTLAVAPAGAKNVALLAAAGELRKRRAAIRAANAADRAGAGRARAMPARLGADAARVETMARGLEEIAALPDPVGTVAAEWRRPNGLTI